MGARRFSVSRSHYGVAVALIRNMSVHDLQPLGGKLVVQYSGETVRQLVAERRSQGVS